MGQDKGAQPPSDLENQTERLLELHSRVTHHAAFPNHTLIFLCRKFTEMSLIVFLEKNGHRVTNEKYTLDMLLTRIKQSDEIKLPKLVEKKILIMREFGNLASHATMEFLSPLEMWKNVRSPFFGIAKWILQDELSLRPAEWGDGTRGDYYSKELSQAEVIEEGFHYWVKHIHDNEDLFHFPLAGIDLFQYKVFDTKMRTLAPRTLSILDAIIHHSIEQKDRFTDEELVQIFGYTIRLAFMGPMTALEAMMADFDAQIDIIEEWPKLFQQAASDMDEMYNKHGVDPVDQFREFVQEKIEEIEGDDDTIEDDDDDTDEREEGGTLR